MRKNTFFFYLIIVLFTFFFWRCSHQKSYFFEANEIKGHPSPDQIQKIIQTEPDTSFFRLFFGKKRFIQLYYSEDSVEFRFTDEDGSLLETIIHKPSLDYTPESITKFGLKYIEPAEQDTAAFFRWIKQYDGFDVVNFYKVGSRKTNRKVNYKIYFRLK